MMKIWSDALSVSPSVAERSSDFNEKVLEYLKVNHPECDLTLLLEKLKSLSPHPAKTLTELGVALNYAGEKLHAEEAEKKYVENTLDKRRIQLLGINYFMNDMMVKMIFPAENDSNKPEQW